MSTLRRPWSRPVSAQAAALLAALTLAGCAVDSQGVGTSLPRDSGKATVARAAPATPSPSPRVPDYVRTFRSSRRAGPIPAAPARIRIAAIGVDSRLERLARQPDGTVGVPVDWFKAGWYTGSPRPGQAGAAVILGHVDSPYGPAVFTRLAALRRGDVVELVRRDGSVVRFAVQRREQHRRSRFPAVEVYWPTLTPELRLITCGGQYDRSNGGYQDNVIVFARAIGVRR